MTQPEQPAAPGYYWQYDAGIGWHQVRPMNYWHLRQYQARMAREAEQHADEPASARA